MLGQGLQDAPGRGAVRWCSTRVRASCSADAACSCAPWASSAAASVSPAWSATRLRTSSTAAGSVGAGQLAPERPAVRPRPAVSGPGAGQRVRGLVAGTALVAPSPPPVAAVAGRSASTSCTRTSATASSARASVDGGHRRPAAVGQPLLDVGEPLGVEEPLEHLAARPRGWPAGTPRSRPGAAARPWRTAPGPCRRRPGSRCADLVVAGGSAAPTRRRPAPRAPPWPGPWWCRCRASWAAANSGERMIRSRRPAGGELEHAPRARRRPRRGRCAATGALGARAGHRGVQREADGVEHAGLAGAGGPWMRKRPAAESASKSTSTRCGRTARTP